MLQIVSAKVNTFPVLRHPSHSLFRESVSLSGRPGQRTEELLWTLR
jgi:hypothetical protein